MNSNKKTCPVCLSTRFFKRDGALFCGFGHRLEGFFEQQDEPSETCSRLIKSNVRKKLKKTQNVFDPNNDDDGSLSKERRNKVIRGIGIVFREQISFLIAEFDFPLVIKKIGHDLFAMYIEIVNELAENVLKLKIAKNKEKSCVAANPQTDPVSESDDENLPSLPCGYFEDQEPSIQISSKNTIDTESVQIDKPIAEFLAFNFSWSAPQLEHSVVLIYIIFLFLNIPVMINDLKRLAVQGIIPYYDLYDSLPDDCRKWFRDPRYCGRYPYASPKVQTMALFISTFSCRIERRFSVKIPAIPFALLTLRLSKLWKAPIVWTHWVHFVANDLNGRLVWNSYSISDDRKYFGPELLFLSICEFGIHAYNAYRKRIQNSPSLSLFKPEEAVDACDSDSSCNDNFHVPYKFNDVVEWAIDDPEKFIDYAMDNIFKNMPFREYTKSNQLISSISETCEKILNHKDILDEDNSFPQQISNNNETCFIKKARDSLRENGFFDILDVPEKEFCSEITHLQRLILDFSGYSIRDINYSKKNASRIFLFAKVLKLCAPSNC